MSKTITELFNEAENRYLQPEELQALSGYVDSLPVRLDVYKRLRDQEAPLMQKVADQLQGSLPQEPVSNIERSLKQALLLLRTCAMAMLLDDEALVEEKLVTWTRKMVQAYGTQQINRVLYRLLQENLQTLFVASDLALLERPMTQAESAFIGEQPPASS